MRVEVGGDGADVFCDRPFVVVEDDDEPLGLRPRVVQRFVADAAGQGGVTRDADHVLVPAAQIAAHRHAQSGGRARSRRDPRRSSRARSRCASRNPLSPWYWRMVSMRSQPAGEHFVDVALVADIEDEPVLWRVEDAMQRDRQFDHAEIRPEMSAGLRQNIDELFAHLLRELRQLLFRDRFDVRGRTDSFEKGFLRGNLRRG